MRKKRIIVGICVVMALIVVIVNRQDRYLKFSNTWSDTFKNPVSNAINVYTYGNSSGVTFYEGQYDGVRYEVIEVIPDENTRIQLDYAGDTPKLLDELYDVSLVSSGWKRIGGINGGFFNSGATDFGKPTGLVMVNGEFQSWKNEMTAPAYGHGNVIVYFNHDNGFKMKYHGWKDGTWMPITDTTWHYDIESNAYVYDVPYEYGLSGSYMLLENGMRVWKGKTHSAYWNRSKDSPVTLFGQKEDGTYLLVITQEIGGGEKETALMKSLGGVNALRLDGSNSTGMLIMKKYMK